MNTLLIKGNFVDYCMFLDDDKICVFNDPKIYYYSFGDIITDIIMKKLLMSDNYFDDVFKSKYMYQQK